MLEDTQLDEVDQIGTIVLSPSKEKPASFITLIPHIEFIIPDMFTNIGWTLKLFCCPSRGV
jgi:hypothetical protein